MGYNDDNGLGQPLPVYLPVAKIQYGLTSDTF